MSARTSSRRLAALTAALLLAVGVTHAAPAPAQAADPVVTVTAANGSVFSADDCKGQTQTNITEPIRVTLTRSGDASASLDVALSYGGSLASTSGLPVQATIAAGEAQVVLEASPETGGDLTVDLTAGAGYTIGSPGSASTSMSQGIADLGCNIGDVSTTQTIERGTTPAAIDVEEVAYSPPDGLVRSVEGTVPPGTAFHLDGTWDGVATELGTFRFSEFFCEDDGWCPYRADIEVIVVESGAIPPVTGTRPPAAPARAVPGTPQLTG
ncbi:MAG TPA: hypothetical protein VNQ33_08210 [Acidimicrobiales bacterium]|nr:hypothetical protein [Acidimicrobiales bacterium]